MAVLWRHEAQASDRTDLPVDARRLLFGGGSSLTSRDPHPLSARSASHCAYMQFVDLRVVADYTVIEVDVPRLTTVAATGQ